VRRFNEKYDACDVDVPRPTASVRETLKTVAHYLLSDKVVPPTRSGDNDHGIEIPMSDILGDTQAPGIISVQPLEPSFIGKGACWHVSSSGCFGDGIAKAIQDKSLNKNYEVGQVPCKPQLLLYYNGDPPYMNTFPFKEGVNQLRSVWGSRFTDVWVFDAQKSVLILHEVA